MPLTAQAQAFLDAIAEQDRPAWHEMTPQQGREVFDGLGDLFGKGPELSRVEDHKIPGDVNVRVFRDGESGYRPCVMYFHGGGWVLGNTRTHDPLCRRIAKHSGCTVISVDYGLAPENPFPKPLDDCYAATSYVAAHPSEFGIDPERIAVAGDSAGGNLVAAVSIKARDENGPSIQLQVMIYPVIEPNFETDSYRQFAEGYGLTMQGMKWFWQQYLGERSACPLSAPSIADSLAGLPTAHVVTAEYDVLRDEGESFATQLAAAGVTTTRQRYHGNLHGFIHFSGLFDDGIEATVDIAEILRSYLAG